MMLFSTSSARQHHNFAPICTPAGYAHDSLLLHYNNVTGNVPLFGDLLLAEDRVYAVLNLRLVRDEGWHTAEWTFERDGHVVECETFGQDPHLHTLILYVDQYKLGIDGLRLHYVTVRGRLRNSCTSTLSGNELDHLPEWIAYNKVQGMDHTYIYVNDDFAKAKAALQPFEDAGLATLVDWTPPSQHGGSFLYQMAQQNSCLLRARGRAHWVALHDSDEFFYAVKPWENVEQMLKKLVHDGADGSIGAVQARTWFYGVNSNEAQRPNTTSRLRLARCTARDTGPVYVDREKLIVRPEHVHYVSVHTVTLGMPTQTMDAGSEMRLVHYKEAGHRFYNTADAVMQKWVEPVQELIDGVLVGA